MPTFNRRQLDRWHREDSREVSRLDLLVWLWSWWPAILLPALIVLAAVIKVLGAR